MKTILLVDDNDNHLDLYGGIIQDNGYETVKARSAEEALAIINKRDIHLVVIDVKMKGLSGLDALTIIDREFPLVPVILHTGFNFKNDRCSGIADAYVTKSSTGQELIASIQDVFKRYGA